MVRFLAILLLVCFGCQTGRIPCPKPKGAKLIKSGKRYRAYSSTTFTRIEPKDLVAETPRDTRPVPGRFVKNVSVEEWDCPEPGAKKYMPKKVKANIRKNARQFRKDERKSQADSTLVSGQ